MFTEIVVVVMVEEREPNLQSHYFYSFVGDDEGLFNTLLGLPTDFRKMLVTKKTYIIFIPV